MDATAGESALQVRTAERLGRQAKTIVGVVVGPSASTDSSDAICSGLLVARHTRSRRIASSTGHRSRQISGEGLGSDLVVGKLARPRGYRRCGCPHVAGGLYRWRNGLKVCQQPQPKRTDAADAVRGADDVHDMPYVKRGWTISAIAVTPGLTARRSVMSISAYGRYAVVTVMPCSR